MKLRSGRQTPDRNDYYDILYESHDALLDSIYVLNDIQQMHAYPWFAFKVKQTTSILNYICEYSDEKFSSIDAENKWLRTMYLRAIEIIYAIIEASYTATSLTFNVRTKRALIRILDAAHQVQLKTGRVLWATRNEPHIREVLDVDTDDAEMLYRTLRHIISDESLAYDYEIYTYNDGEYSDEETWDYYFAANVEHFQDCDRFLNQVKTCLERPIRHWNLRMRE